MKGIAYALRSTKKEMIVVIKKNKNILQKVLTRYNKGVKI